MATWMPSGLQAQYDSIGSEDKLKLALLQNMAQQTPQAQMVGGRYIAPGLGAAMPLIAALVGGKVQSNTEAEKNAFLQQNADKIHGFGPEQLIGKAPLQDIAAFNQSGDFSQVSDLTKPGKAQTIPVGDAFLKDGAWMQKVKTIMPDGSVVESTKYAGNAKQGPVTYSQEPMRHPQTGALLGIKVTGSDGSVKVVNAPEYAMMTQAGRQGQVPPAPNQLPGLGAANPNEAVLDTPIAGMGQGNGATPPPPPIPSAMPPTPQSAGQPPIPGIPQAVAQAGMPRVSKQGGVTTVEGLPPGQPARVDRTPVGYNSKGEPIYAPTDEFKTSSRLMSANAAGNAPMLTEYIGQIKELAAAEDALAGTSNYITGMREVLKGNSFSGPWAQLQADAGAAINDVFGLTPDALAKVSNTKYMQHLNADKLAKMLQDSSLGRTLTDSDMKLMAQALVSLDGTPQSRERVLIEFDRLFTDQANKLAKTREYLSGLSETNDGFRQASAFLGRPTGAAQAVQRNQDSKQAEAEAQAAKEAVAPGTYKNLRIYNSGGN